LGVRPGPPEHGCGQKGRVKKVNTARDCRH
jgi:hypothetical protein